jgi:hypothetical protein
LALRSDINRVSAVSMMGRFRTAAARTVRALFCISARSAGAPPLCSAQSAAA